MKFPGDLLIRSGGQTGADRAALDWAIGRGIPHTGWCPKGRLAEDGAIGSQYRLQETATPAYPERTRLNVEDSDATVLFSISPELTGGTLLTRRFAEQAGKPWIHLHKETRKPAQALLEFLLENNIFDLNVAGPRNSTEPAVHGFVREVFDSAWGS